MLTIMKKINDQNDDDDADADDDDDDDDVHIMKWQLSASTPTRSIIHLPFHLCLSLN